MTTKTPVQPTRTPTDLTIREVHYQGTPRYEIATQFMDRKDAEKVLRAVNAHQYLVDVLKGFKQDIESGNFGEKGAIATINTALARASE